MRVAVTTGAGRPLALQDRAEPSPGAGELLVRVGACGICGSDLHMADHIGTPDVVMGHELAGTVVGLGADVSGFAEGDEVAVFPLVACGHCDACRRGLPAHCTGSSALIGWQRPGGYSELVVTSARDTFKLPSSVDVKLGALVEPLAVARHAVERSHIEPGASVLVLGGGPVGQAVTLWLQQFGAREVVVSDPTAHRRALAERVGATATIDPTTQDVAGAFEAVAGSAPSRVIECVGVPGLIQHAADVAAREAHITVVGVCIGADTWAPMTAIGKELGFQFVVYYRVDDFRRTIAALDDGTLDASALITDEITLDDLPARFEALKHPTTECKVLVRPNGT